MPGTLLAAAVVPEVAAVLDAAAVVVFGAALVGAGRAADVAAATALGRADDELLAEDVGLLPGEVAGLAVLGGSSRGLFRPEKRPQYLTENLKCRLKGMHA